MADMVAEWYAAVSKPARSAPTLHLNQGELSQIRRKLREEHLELDRAIRRRDVAAAAGELGDLVYVAYGAALQFGIDLDAVLDEVHRANMSKPNSDGSVPRGRGGRILRGDRYQPPDLRRVLGLPAEVEERRRSRLLWWRRGGNS